VRLFVAVYPPEPALDHLERFAADLAVVRARDGGVNTRLVARPLWHVTLAFLGEVPDSRAEAAGDALDRAVDTLVRMPPSLHLTGGEKLGHSTMAVGLGGDVEKLRKVTAAVRRELRAARFHFDERRFQPHLTLARPGDRLPAATVREDVERLDAYRGPSWTVDGLALVSSHLGPHPRHETIHHT
jgi:RNA 2',3'-cyclic 3'-phosphodiesterase